MHWLRIYKALECAPKKNRLRKSNLAELDSRKYPKPNISENFHSISVSKVSNESLSLQNFFILKNKPKKIEIVKKIQFS